MSRNWACKKCGNSLPDDVMDAMLDQIFSHARQFQGQNVAMVGEIICTGCKRTITIQIDENTLEVNNVFCAEEN